jgi:nicotinamidase/pyrazinamidase
MKALIMIDIQNDFLPTGALAVPEGDQIIPLVNRLQPKFDLVALTQDWHPKEHKSFASQHDKQPGEVIILNGLDQILWPVHCVQGEFGAELAPGLNIDLVDRSFQKGTDPEIDSYSGFFDNDRRKATGMGDYLKEKGVTAVYIVGLATDYCVKFSALDANELGFDTHVIIDGTRGVNLNEGDVDAAVEEMKSKGITIINSSDIT